MDVYPVGIVISQIKQLQARNIQKLLRQGMDVSGLNSAQMHILFQLWEEDNISISQLSTRTQLANTTLTTMLDRLEKHGFLRRVQNPENRREIRLLLTQRAKDIKCEYSKIATIMQEINFKGFTAEEEVQLRGYLNRMKENLLEAEEKKA